MPFEKHVNNKIQRGRGSAVLANYFFITILLIFKNWLFLIIFCYVFSSTIFCHFLFFITFFVVTIFVCPKLFAPDFCHKFLSLQIFFFITNLFIFNSSFFFAISFLKFLSSTTFCQNFYGSGISQVPWSSFHGFL